MATMAAPAEQQPKLLSVDFDDGYSNATRKGYACDWKRFITWCLESGHQPYLIGPETVAAFVDAHADILRPATVSRAIAAIGVAHRDRNMADPTKARVVRVAMKRMWRVRGRRQRQASPINFAMRGKMLAAARDDLLGKRDKAMLAVAYDVGCRRSELMALRIQDMEREDDGSATILLAKSKVDQEGRGLIRYLARDTLAVLDRWLAAAKIVDGVLFRSVNVHGQVRGPLPVDEVARIFKKMAEDAGYSADVVKNISGHSTRVGMAQDMAAAGIDIASIMNAGGWRTPNMLARYIERLSARQSAAARLAAFQNRT